MSRSDPQFNLRIPESLRDLVTLAAKENKRSATAEILARLEQSFHDPDDFGRTDIDRLLHQSTMAKPHVGGGSMNVKGPAPGAFLSNRSVQEDDFYNPISLHFLTVQKQAFLDSIEQSIAQADPKTDLSVLKALRDATKSELATITRKLDAVLGTKQDI